MEWNKIWSYAHPTCLQCEEELAKSGIKYKIEMIIPRHGGGKKSHYPCGMCGRMTKKADLIRVYIPKNAVVKGGKTNVSLRNAS